MNNFLLLITSHWIKFSLKVFFVVRILMKLRSDKSIRMIT